MSQSSKFQKPSFSPEKSSARERERGKEMSAKVLYSLTDENRDLQKQIGCMNGIFQLFDRHHIRSSRRNSRNSRKKLPLCMYSSLFSNIRICFFFFSLILIISVLLILTSLCCSTVIYFSLYNYLIKIFSLRQYSNRGICSSGILHGQRSFSLLTSITFHRNTS